MKFIKLSFHDNDFEHCLDVSFKTLVCQFGTTMTDLDPETIKAAIVTLADGYNQASDIMSGHKAETKQDWLNNAVVEMTTSEPQQNNHDVQIVYNPHTEAVYNQYSY